MGKYRFRLSDMIPNAWFYKLKDSSRTRNQSITHPTKKKQQPTSSSSSAAVPAQPSNTQQPHLSNQRKSYHFTRDPTAASKPDTPYNNLATDLRAMETHYPEPPRTSSKYRRSTKRNRQSNRLTSPKLVASSVSAGCICRATLESVWIKPDSTPEDYSNSPLDSSSDNESLLPQYGSDLCFMPETFDGMLSWSASCPCRDDSDFVIETENRPSSADFDEPDKLDGLDTVSEFDLPPIITKPNKSSDMDNQKKERNEPTKTKRSSAKFEERNAYGSFSVKVVKESFVTTSSKEQKLSPVRKSWVHSPGVKLRTNSPRILNRRVQGRKSILATSSSSSRRSLSESFAVVKSSKDPRKDFMESMVEMILENNIFASKDLEDLLACYLSLNSDEYHDLIIKVFKQIWFDIIDPRLK